MAHADRNGARFNGGAGLSPSASFYYPTRQNQRPLWAVYLTPERPSMTLNLQIVAGVDRDLARRLIGDLRRIAVVNDALPNDDEALLDRYPTVYLAGLAEDPAAVDGVLAALDRVVEGWK